MELSTALVESILSELLPKVRVAGVWAKKMSGPFTTNHGLYNSLPQESCTNVLFSIRGERGLCRGERDMT